MSLEEDRDRYGYSKPHPWVEDQYLEDLQMESLFDADEGRARKREAMERAYRNADADWKVDAMDAIKAVAEMRTEFTADAVWGWLTKYRPGSETHERRALGPLLKQAGKRGWIVQTGEHHKTVMRQAHRRPKEIWRSLICREQNQ